MCIRDRFKLQATAAYLYGAPAAGNRFTAKLAVMVEQHPLEQLPGYFFGDPTLTLPREAKDVIDTSLDENGEHSEDTVSYTHLDVYKRQTGRNTSGVRGIRLRDGEEVVSLIVAESRGDAGADEEDILDEGVETAIETSGDDAEIAVVADDGGLDILTVTENGYGKRTPLLEYPRKGRGTQGVIGIQTSERNGRLIGAVLLSCLLYTSRCV